MNLVSLLIALIVLIAVGAILYWFMGKVPLPEPFKIVVYAVLAIVAILIVAGLAGFGPVVIR